MKFLNRIQSSMLRILLKDEIREERTYFGLTLATGIISALVAVALHKGTHYLTHFFGTDHTFTWRSFCWGGAAILVSGYLTTRFFPATSGSGIPRVRVALAVFHGKIPFIDTVAKFFTSLLALSTGVTLGREGPTVGIAAGIGSVLGQYFHMSKKRIKALVAIGSAGGIAAAFNTPISAVVFTLEEVVGDLNAKVLGGIIVSSVVAAVTSQILMGNDAVFIQLNYKLVHPIELIFYVLIGVASAILGPLWVKSLLKLRQQSLKTLRGHRLTFIMLSFCLVAVMSFVHPEILGSGHQTIENVLLSLLLDWKILLTLFCLRYFSTIFCFASGMSGGIFMPTLLLGAILGSLLGIAANNFFPDIASNTGAYALVGMGAFFVAVIRAPFTSIIMIFELTRDYNIILPLMMANIVSYFLANKIHGGSVYESISEQDGIHLPTKEDHEVLEGMTVEEAMVREPFCLETKMTVAEAVKKIGDHKYSGFPVLQKDRLMGMLACTDIGKAYIKREFETPVIDLAEKKIITIYPDQSLFIAFHKLKRFNVSRLPVVSRLDDRQLIGIITAEDIVSNFGFHIQEEEANLDEIISSQTS